MNSKMTDEIQGLFTKFRRMMGAPVLDVEITDEQLCEILDTAVEDYAEKVQNWIIDNQWATLYGKKLNLSGEDLARGLTLRTMDLSKDFSYWFSKEVGLQQRGPWELKKDFFTIEPGKQSYLIPSGREINGVLYCNPSTVPAAMYANYAGLDTLGFVAGGYGVSGGGSYGPLGGFYIAQSSDIAYMAADLQFKNRLVRGDLTYKVTGGPDGTHIIHLMSVPNSLITFGGGANLPGALNLSGCAVWYTYYDVSSEADADECRRQNPDVVLSPDQVPLTKMDFAFLNEPAKVVVRKLFFALAKRTLALIWGKFNGKISIMDAEATLNYQMLLTQGDNEYKETMDELVKRLERMSPNMVLKREAENTDSLSKILSHVPLKPMVI